MSDREGDEGKTSPPAPADLAEVAGLVTARNGIDGRIAAITGRPVVAGHLGEWIASAIFDIQLEDSAVSRAIDGRFRSGPLTNRSVNIKWYGKREGMLDMTEEPSLDYYLVMTGPRAAAASSRGSVRPLVISGVYIFDAADLLTASRERGLGIGVATSVLKNAWDAAELYPTPTCPLLTLTESQTMLLGLFSPRTA